MSSALQDQADLILEALDMLGISSYSFVGHGSSGASTSIRIAIKRRSQASVLLRIAGPEIRLTSWQVRCMMLISPGSMEEYAISLKPKPGARANTA